MNYLRNTGVAAALVASGFAGGLALSGFNVGSVKPELAAVLNSPARPVYAATRPTAQTMPGNQWFGPLDLALAFGGGLVALGIIRGRRRSARNAALKYATRETAARNDLQSLERTLAHFSDRPFQEAPRELVENPYDMSVGGVDFAARVQLAIEGSLRHSRVIGVVHFRVPPKGFLFENGSPAKTAAEMAAVLRASTRPSDGVFISDEHNVFVFLSLISRKEKMEKLAKRLADSLYATQPAPVAQICSPGCAMYPIDGYDAGELMEAARARSAPWRLYGQKHQLIQPVEVKELAHMTR